MSGSNRSGVTSQQKTAILVAYRNKEDPRDVHYSLELRAASDAKQGDEVRCHGACIWYPVFQGSSPETGIYQLRCQNNIEDASDVRVHTEGCAPCRIHTTVHQCTRGRRG